MLDYPEMPAEWIQYWVRRACWEWASRPGPVWTYLTSMISSVTLRSVMESGPKSLG